MGGERAGTSTSSRLRKAAKKMVSAACGCASFSRRPLLSAKPHCSAESTSDLGNSSRIQADVESSPLASASKNLCAICLDPLSCSPGASPGHAIFTAQCSHAFHFVCISSNVRHGNVTCPICRAHWSQLPHNLHSPSIPCNQNDPILRILDDSIATFRVHRRSFLRSARYEDDEPIDPDQTTLYHSRLDLSLVPVPTPPAHPSIHSLIQVTGNPSLYYPSGISSLCHFNGSPSLQHPHPSSEHFSHLAQAQTPYMCASNKAYLLVKLPSQRATDLVLVASPNGPHLRLLKQAMAFVVFCLREVDRLAIVTHSSAAARVFPLKRMTTYGKRAALQVIDRLSYMGQLDPMEGLKKGIKIFEDRMHKNPESCILHLSDSPTRPYHDINMETSISIHQFHVGFGFGTHSGFVMHEFEEFLSRMLGGVIREIQLSIGDANRIVRLGELRGGEEKRVLLELGDCGHVRVGYRYVEVGSEECIRTGEAVVRIGDKGIRNEDAEIAGRDIGAVGRTSSAESWDYHDPYMARRWAKHLHGYRL